MLGFGKDALFNVDSRWPWQSSSACYGSLGRLAGIQDVHVIFSEGSVSSPSKYLAMSTNLTLTKRELWNAWRSMKSSKRSEDCVAPFAK